MRTLPADTAEKLFETAAEAGVPRAALLRAASVTEGAALDSQALCSLYERAARLSGDDAFGLHVGERTSPRMYGLLGYLIANSGTFGEALTHLAQFQRVWTEAVEIELVELPDAVALRYRHTDPIPPRHCRQESEQMMAGFVAFAREVLGEPVQPLEARFRHGAPDDLSEHRRIFGCPLSFDAEATELVLPSRLLALPLPKADPRLLKLVKEQAGATLQSRAPREPFEAQLKGHLEAAIIGSGEVSVAALAASMRIGPRTLQRRLRERGQTFREASDQARIALAKSLLAESKLSLAQIAFRLGYSQPSAFHRAFKRISGETPRRYRNSGSPG